MQDRRAHNRAKMPLLKGPQKKQQTDLINKVEWFTIIIKNTSKIMHDALQCAQVGYRAGYGS